MKTIKILILTLGITLFFSACSTKTESDVLDSSKQDVSELLNKLIEKEKEINRLTLELEKCKSEK
ncbi:hypothetical protein [Poseidonibacter lekithochrous]|uniref:hypothetical protein n=1 Tax=Poseidonibacter lekithochrous TaxID=1904463 RepID=UPI0008FCBC4D|nr:hypothetical protein [Poseidonibacter lekithochrous]QKJ21449.1 hypothetical protein ALEK_0128 [Poseidonibacter lekithochrous]